MTEKEIIMKLEDYNKARATGDLQADGPFLVSDWMAEELLRQLDAKKMLALLERWVAKLETGPTMVIDSHSFSKLRDIYEDTKTLLKEAKVVKHGN